MTHIPGLPLFETYPHVAGFKEATTSREAAEGIEGTGKAKRLRRAILALYRAGLEATADEVAYRIGENILDTRPRVSELHKQGFLEPTGQRRRADGGRPAHVWRLIPNVKA